MALGIPPMPSCRQAPLGICGTMRFATFRSTSVAAPAAAIWPMGGLLPSTTPVNLGDVHPVLGAAQALGHVPVDLHDDLFGLIAHGTQVGSTGAKVEIAVLVHGGHLEHRHIHGVRAVAIVAGQFRVADGGVEGEALGNGLALNAAHVPAVPGHVGSRILDLEDGGHPHQDAAAEVDTLQLRQALGNARRPRQRGCSRPSRNPPSRRF